RGRRRCPRGSRRWPGEPGPSSTRRWGPCTGRTMVRRRSSACASASGTSTPAASPTAGCWRRSPTPCSASRWRLRGRRPGRRLGGGAGGHPEDRDPAGVRELFPGGRAAAHPARERGVRGGGAGEAAENLRGLKQAMAKIHVLMKKEDLDGERLPGKVVVVLDVLFATSSIVTALAHGAVEVIPTLDGPSALSVASGRAAESFVLSGELNAIT